MAQDTQLWNRAISLVKSGDLDQGNRVFKDFLKTVPKEDQISYIDKFEETAEEYLSGLKRGADDQLQDMVDKYIRPIAGTKPFEEVKATISYVVQKLPESSRSKFVDLCSQVIAEEKGLLIEKFNAAVLANDEAEAARLKDAMLEGISNMEERRGMEKKLDDLENSLKPKPKAKPPEKSFWQKLTGR